MAKKRANREGNICKRKDGRWEGQDTVGNDPQTDKPISKNVLGKTQAEVREKIKEAMAAAEKIAGEYVFPSPSGGPISPDSVLHMLHRVLKRAGLDRVRFHDLRHTFATLALQNGVDVKTLSGLLGHYSAGFTLDTYGHITSAMKRDAANKVGNFLAGSV